MYGTSRIRAGAIVKYAPDPAYAMLAFYGPVICETELSRPAFFTSQFDATVGEVIDNQNTTPVRYFQALANGSAELDLQHVRIRHADYAVHTAWYAMRLRHCQITHCGTALYTEWGPCTLGNVLFHDVDTVFSGSTYNAQGAHLTVDDCNLLTHDWAWAGYSSVSLANSLLFDVAADGAVPLATGNSQRPTTNPFQSVGGGSHYLASGSPLRGAGTTAGIDANLLAELKHTTTWPPLERSGTLTADTILAPFDPRNDPAAPDIGYAYDALDHLVHGLTVQGDEPTVTLLVTN